MAAMAYNLEPPADYTIHWLDNIVQSIPHWVHPVLAVIGGFIGMFAGPHYFGWLPKQGAAVGAFVGLLSVYILRLAIMLAIYGALVAGALWLMWWLYHDPRH
jgi:hypothetical protein